jgi:hypothetical protein
MIEDAVIRRDWRRGAKGPPDVAAPIAGTFGNRALVRGGSIREKV